MISEYRFHSFENLNKMNFVGVAPYGIPPIIGEIFTKCEWIPFNYATGFPRDRRHETGVHFFVDDYQFARVWSHPDIYLKAMNRFAAVCSPDFSLYTDMPLALQIYNHFRKHWVGAYWQMHGIKVIPTIAWSTPDSYKWCFDGEPTRTTVAVSSVGSLKTSESRSLFIRGYSEMIDRLQPTIILFCGTIPTECEALAPTLQIPQFSEKFSKGCMKNGW